MTCIIRVLTLGLLIALCSTAVAAQPATRTLDRTVLPIAEPSTPSITEQDARKAKAPPRFEVKAPAEAGEPRTLAPQHLGPSGLGRCRAGGCRARALDLPYPS
jgi:arylsulfatase